MRRFFSRFRKQTKNEDGAVMILMVFLLMILLGFAALAFDYGIVYYKNSKLQTAVDIAARAGSRVMMENKFNETMSDEDKEKAIEETIKYYLEQNGFPETELSVCEVQADIDKGISIDAKSKVELNFARVFTDKPIPISAGTTAITEVTEDIDKPSALDVVFVLDVSSSMFRTDSKVYKDRFIAMAEAVNVCIEDIMETNDQNRVGIVTYSYENSDKDAIETDVILDMTNCPSNTSNKGGGSFRPNLPNYLGYKGYNSGGRLIYDGTAQTVWLLTKDGERKYTKGGTYIQYGIAKGSELLWNTAQADMGKPQECVRFPAVFVLTDGEATLGTTDWDNPSADSMKKVTHRDPVNVQPISYYTILTAAYWKNRLAEQYTLLNGEKTPCSFYTVGFRLDGVDDSREDIARGLLNPTYFKENLGSMRNNANELYGQLERSGVDYNYVNQYYKADEGTDLTEVLRQFAKDVVEITRTYNTKLVR